MSTINPAGLYSQNEGIFNAKPYVWHEEQLQAHQDAKDQANEDFYRNLPNTINDKGLRDIDVPGVNQARNNLSQYFIQNKKSILKGNTAESYNYQKQIRDLQGNVQEGLNASKISNQIAGYKLDRTKADMFYGPEKDEDQRLHNLSVFDPNRKGIDLTNFTAAPKTWDDADELARKNYMGTYKASSFEPKTRILDPNDPTKDQIVSHPVFTDGQFNQMKLKSLYDYNGKLSYKNMVDKISADPAQKAILGQIYQEYNKGAAPVSQSDYAFATDLAKLTAPVQKESEVTNGQRRIDAANAENDRRASRNQGYKQANIAANKNNTEINDVWSGIDKVNTDSKNKGQVYTQVNLNNSDGQKVLVSAAKDAEKNTPHDNSTIKTRKETDGRIGIYGADDNRFITYVDQKGVNVSAKQPDVKAKKAVVAQGNSNQKVPVQPVQKKKLWQ